MLTFLYFIDEHGLANTVTHMVQNGLPELNGAPHIKMVTALSKLALDNNISQVVLKQEGVGGSNWV